MTAVLDAPVRRAPVAARVTLTEGRRSAAPGLFVAVAAMGTVLLFVHPDLWVGRWQPLAGYLRLTLILVFPLCAAVATWQGGRERRRAANDLLAATSRPGWHALLAIWTALVVAATAGLLVTFAVGSAFVAPYATYSGGGWWWLALGCMPPVAAAAALGLAVGRWVPLRIAGLLIAVLLYVAQALPVYLGDAGVMWLDPMIGGVPTDSRLAPGTHALQALWFGGLTLALLAVAALRSVPATRTTALLTAVAGLVPACAGAVPLVAGPGYDRWLPDPAARQAVCAPGTPQVCVTIVDAYLLADVAPAARRVLNRLSGVPGAPTRAVSTPQGGAHPADALVLSGLVPNLRGGLDDSHSWGDLVTAAVQTSIMSRACNEGETVLPGFEQRILIEQIARYWILQQDPEPDPQQPEPGTAMASDPYAERTRAGLAALQDLTLQQQRAWVGRVYATRDTCDAKTQNELLATAERP